MADGLDDPSAVDREYDDEEFSQRRVRHITSIQIRNLTPFPVRDAFASALTQPSEQSQFTTHGHLSDDLDVTVGRKRGRRISMNSVHTLKSVKSDDGDMASVEGQNVPESRGRRAGSRVSFSDKASLPTGSSPSSARRPAGSGPTIRPGNRVRTTSVVSSHSVQFVNASLSSATSGLPNTSAPVSFSAMLPDHSQKGLEKVFKSRLVETFVAITVPSSGASPDEGLSQPVHQVETPPRGPSPKSRSSTPPHSAKEKLSSLQHKVNSSIGSISRKGPKASSPDPSKGTFVSRRESASTRTTSTITSVHSKSASSSSLRLNHKAPSVSAQKSSTPHIPPRLQASKTSSPPPKASSSLPPLSVPNYLSPIHRPSTNPSFPIDARVGYDFAEWTDLSSDMLRVEVWGKARPRPGEVNGIATGKGKEKETGDDLDDGEKWKVLEEWNINLAQLVPLPEDLASHPSHLPFNTLLVTLSPPGQTYYIPPASISRSRSPSPAGGYNSDPESGLKKLKHAGELTLPLSPGGLNNTNRSALVQRSRRRGTASKLRREGTKTAGWQDLFKLVTLQSCILDTDQSLSEIIRDVDKGIESDDAFPLRRECSERESRLETLREECLEVKEKSNQLKVTIKTRREQLHVRREMLSVAKEQHEQERLYEVEQQDIFSEEQRRLQTLRRRFPPTRTTLLTTLSSIYPIELLSPPDLLYTILSVPLPIPLSSTDPAPPLSLPAHKDVTEEAVATSLGYAAQVVQLLAAYLGKGLVYPVTCVGSQSLIRDGISAMVGPRMFPLFSKGVDTYRFEYGVFLLNKDIELLMADRDLRALDMRHTLPNLKNLLLTLTDGEGAQLALPRSLNSPMSSTSGLESPRAGSPTSLELPPRVADDESTQVDTAATAESNSPPASGSTTPTATTPIASTSDIRKSRAFPGLSPLTDFLRSRYPSASARPSVKPVDEGVEPASENVSTATEQPQDTPTLAEPDDNVDDDADRRTIRGAAVDGKAMNGHVNGSEQGRDHGEKVVDEEISAPPKTPPPLVAQVS